MPDEQDKGEVVALATGSVCLAGQNICEDGRTLTDCHAIVIARRAFLKYVPSTYYGRNNTSNYRHNAVVDVTMQYC